MQMFDCLTALNQKLMAFKCQILQEADAQPDIRLGNAGEALNNDEAKNVSKPKASRRHHLNGNRKDGAISFDRLEFRNSRSDNCFRNGEMLYKLGAWDMNYGGVTRKVNRLQQLRNEDFKELLSDELYYKYIIYSALR